MRASLRCSAARAPGPRSSRRASAAPWSSSTRLAANPPSSASRTLPALTPAAAARTSASADGLDRRRDDELIGGLRDLTGPASPDVDDPTAHRLEQRPRLLERLRPAADHDRERLLAGADLAARHRRVEQVDALLRQRRRPLAREQRIAGAHVDDDGAPGAGRRRGRVAEDHGVDVGRIGQHQDHDVGRARDVGRRGGRGRAGGRRAPRRGRGSATRTVSAKPASSRWRAIGRPMTPEADEPGAQRLAAGPRGPASVARWYPYSLIQASAAARLSSSAGTRGRCGRRSRSRRPRRGRCGSRSRRCPGSLRPGASAIWMWPTLSQQPAVRVAAARLRRAAGGRSRTRSGARSSPTASTSRRRPPSTRSGSPDCRTGSAAP